MTRVDQVLQAAVRNHQDGQLAAAMRLYHDVLSLDPSCADAWNLVGVVAHQIGQQDDAIKNIQRAISLDDGVADYHLNLAAAFLAASQPQQAEGSCRTCLILRPDYPEAFNSLGNALAGLGRLDEALDAYRRALELRPAWADAACNLGRLLHSLGRLDEAERYLRQAVEDDPQHYQALNNLGLVYRKRGSCEQAADCYRRALEIQPDSAEVLFNLGNVLRQLSRFEEALDALTQATGLRADHANAWCALGLVQQDLGRHKEALQSLRRAVDADATTKQWPIIYRENDYRYVPAIESWIAALEAAQTTIADISSQCHVPEETVVYAISCWYFELGEPDKAKRVVEEYLKHRSDPIIYSQYLRCLMASPTATKKQFFEGNMQWATQFANDELAAADSDFLHYDLDPDKKLRIGFVCGYANTALFQTALLPLLKDLDRNSFEVFLFNLGQVSAKWLVEGVDECIDFLVVDDDELYREIRKRKVDLLIDLNGRFRLDNPIEVLLRRPAPIQVTYGNMLGTYGLKTVQYILADPYALLEEDDQYYTENIFRFESGDAGTFDIPHCEIRSLPSKDSGVFTFGSFNALFKMNDSVVSTWGKILEKVPNSRLLIKANGVNSPRFRKRLLETLSKHVSRQTDVALEPFSAFDVMLDTYNNVDLGLNTFPYSGGTTTAFALWMGVPSVTLETKGEGMVSGGAGGLLRSPGYDEFVVGSTEEYIDKAVELANNPEHLEHLRKSIRQRLLETARFDPRLFAADFGNQCRKIWKHWLANAEFSSDD